MQHNRPEYAVRFRKYISRILCKVLDKKKKQSFYAFTALGRLKGIHSQVLSYFFNHGVVLICIVRMTHCSYRYRET